MRIEILQTAAPRIDSPRGHADQPARPCTLSIDGNTFTSATPKNSGEAESINRDAEKFRATINDLPPRRSPAFEHVMGKIAGVIGDRATA